MVGAYFPWLEYKWGNVVGVAIKNPLISDIFSEFFVEKVKIADAIARGQWPIWEPGLYSGFPLFSAFNIGAMNPFNLLMVVFNKIDGWSLMVFSQPLLSSVFMYVFLKKIVRSRYAALVGSVVYAFGGFAITWSQFVNVGFVMIWLPLIFYLLEQAKSKDDQRLLIFLGPLFFLVAMAGHFQGLFYTAVLSVLFFIFRFGIKNKKANIYFLIASFLGVGLSCIQLLPTIELLGLSIRFNDGMLLGYNYGLLPKQNLITLIAPDYFGNHSTGNFWGFYNYHETITYAGIMGALGLIYGIFNLKKLKLGKFFVFSAVLALLFQFDTFLGRAIYQYKVPFLSTCAAGRVGLVYLFSVSVLSAFFIKNLDGLKVKRRLELLLLPVMFISIGGSIPLLANVFYKLVAIDPAQTVDTINNWVAIRNLIFPAGIIFLTGLTLLVSKKFKKAKYLLIFLVIFDLFRFGWKFLPFVPKLYVFPKTEVTEFIKNDKSVFRIEKERGPIMTPNTWLGYDLMSPSGYDPLAITEYVKSYSKDLNLSTGGVSRYSELDRYDAEALGKYNVKYLLVIKRNDKGVVGGDSINYRIDESEWKRVFQTLDVAVLQNTKYKERARVIDGEGNDVNGSAIIKSYDNNQVVVDFNNVNGEMLLLADTYYPGWIATLNGKRVKISDEIKPFRTINIEGVSQGSVVFEYKPDSYKWGLIITGVSLGVWLLWFLLNQKN